MKTGLIWFRNDLRLLDNTALVLCNKLHDKLIPLYIFNPLDFKLSEEAGIARVGKHRLQFLCESVLELKTRLQELNSNLVIRCGSPEKVIPALVKEFNVDSVYFHKEGATYEKNTESAVIANTRCQVKPIPDGHTMLAGNQVEKYGGQTFTNWRRRHENLKIEPFVPKPASLKPIPKQLLSNLGDIPKEYQQDVVFDARSVMKFKGGEIAALHRLDEFLKGPILHYKDTRNGMVGKDYSSKISPWLANGCLSVRYVYAKVKELNLDDNPHVSHFIFELLWRDFFQFLAPAADNSLFLKSGFKSKFGLNTQLPITNKFKERRYTGRDSEKERFRKWTSGQTSNSFVNANMRELANTGWMSNRGRQNVASYLIKDLYVDWRWGAEYFESLLIDHDVASNWGNWAYQAGVGNDPRQDRYFSMAKQAKQYDPDETFVKLWCPESG
jgi:deoxyribodipyrimidine photo-lyase